MSEVLNKSSKAIRGKVYNEYRTECLDLVVKMIGTGTWGDGKPILKIKSSNLLKPEKNAVKRDISKLMGLLLYKRNQIAFDGYWQKDACQHWSDLKGCKADETDCDSCASFQRIREQYCKRCGATFLKREDSLVCDPCAKARKKQAQKKWAVMNNYRKGA